MRYSNYYLILTFFVANLFLSSCAVHREPSPEAVSNYNPLLSRVMIDFSIFAYLKTEDELNKELSLKYQNFTLLKRINEDENPYDSQAFVAYDDYKVIVAVRGSSSFQDWFNNLKVGKFTNKDTLGYCQYAAMHGGFHLSARYLKNAKISQDNSITVASEIYRLQKEGRKVYFTGHSLGGAVANVLAFFASYESDIIVDGVYTFGEPRNGNDSYLSCHDTKLRTKTFRFINNRDVVSRIPPFGNYHQVGNLIYFDRYGNITTQNVNDGWFYMTFDVLIGRFARDHFKESYLELIQQHKFTNPFP
jgi:triacylglycerol lipase